MPAIPKPRPVRLAGHVKTTLSLDDGTLDGLDAIVAADPDLASRSAAVRKLVRMEVERTAKAKRT